MQTSEQVSARGSKSDLSAIRRKLLRHYGPPAPPPSRDPFTLLMWEQVAYLVSDARRRDAFEALGRRVGLTPAEIAAADTDLLTEIATMGGAIAAKKRAVRMQESARRALAEWDGDPQSLLRFPLDQAVRALARFPMIGRPGAEKILLFSGAQTPLALESNGLRVLLRLGYGEERPRYAQSYASVRAATAAEERGDRQWTLSLHSLLRSHGQLLCRNKAPHCSECPLSGDCSHYRDLEQAER